MFRDNEILCVPENISDWGYEFQLKSNFVIMSLFQMTLIKFSKENKNEISQIEEYFKWGTFIIICYLNGLHHHYLHLLFWTTKAYKQINFCSTYR